MDKKLEESIGLYLDVFEAYYQEMMLSPSFMTATEEFMKNTIEVWQEALEQGKAFNL